MAPRKTTKAPPRRSYVKKTQGAIVNASFNGDSAMMSPAAKNAAAPSFEQIQVRAYEIFIARGAAHGQDWADWFRAEQELNGTSVAAH